MTPLTSSPTDSQRDGSVDHTLSPARSPTERPERSRNAKAQARHRAKRKAYIEQLEQTVTKLQSVLALTPEQVAAIPPPLVRIRELETENELLRREVEELRRQLDSKTAQMRPEYRRDAYTPLSEERQFDREPKRVRRAGPDAGAMYVTSSPHTHSPPPPLSIPSITGQYPSQSPPHSAGYSAANGASAYSSRAALGNYSYGVPNGYAVPPETPTSSTTSSPSFSPSDYAAPTASHQRALSSSYGPNALPPFSHATPQYELVKLEDEHYSHTSPHHTTSAFNHYPPALHTGHSTQQTAAVAHWPYSSER